MDRDERSDRQVEAARQQRGKHRAHSAHIAAGEPTQEECEKVESGTEMRRGRVSASATGKRCHQV